MTEETAPGYTDEQIKKLKFCLFLGISLGMGLRHRLVYLAIKAALK